MESLNEIITRWYLVLFLVSAGVALAVWVWASKLILVCRYRHGQISKKEYQRRTEAN